jgi:hypothetical protein
MSQHNTGGLRCHDADACAFGQKPCPTPSICGCAATDCSVKAGTHKPTAAVHQIAEPALQALRERMQHTHARFGHAERFVEAPAAVVAEVIGLVDRQAVQIAALEAQLEAIGAGGVEPLRKPVLQVLIDFDQVGAAGPFAVIDGRVRLPAETMLDLARMLKPTMDAMPAAPQAVQAAAHTADGGASHG